MAKRSVLKSQLMRPAFCKPALAFAWLFVAAMGSSANAAERRDPTRPGWQPASADSASNKPAPQLLTAIVIGPGGRRALIGERYLQVGDRVGDARLVRIDFDFIVLQSAAGERIVRLTPVLESRSATKVNGS
ncbi:MAG TPA: hypothetical protein VFV64_02960 [Permianibacter sp.]|nr:hypothetical protein [Permianibacter sp.]